MNKKQRKIYDTLFKEPMRDDILWHDVITLIKAIGGSATQEDNLGFRLKVSSELHETFGIFLIVRNI